MASAGKKSTLFELIWFVGKVLSAVVLVFSALSLLNEWFGIDVHPFFRKLPRQVGPVAIGLMDWLSKFFHVIFEKIGHLISSAAHNAAAQHNTTNEPPVQAPAAVPSTDQSGNGGSDFGGFLLFLAITFPYFSWRLFVSVFIFAAKFGFPKDNDFPGQRGFISYLIYGDKPPADSTSTYRSYLR